MILEKGQGAEDDEFDDLVGGDDPEVVEGTSGRLLPGKPAEPVHLLQRVLSTGGEVGQGLLHGGEEDPLLVQEVQCFLSSPLVNPASGQQLARLDMRKNEKKHL